MREICRYVRIPRRWLAVRRHTRLFSSVRGGELPRFMPIAYDARYEEGAVIIGERVRLRAPERDDIDRWLIWFNDPEVIETLSVHRPMSRDQEERFFQAQLDNPNDVLLAIDTAEGRHIGTIGLHHVDHKNSHAELGIGIGEKDCWSQGYGTDAIRTLLLFAFEELNLNRVYLRVFEDNPRAIRCYEKCGFHHEGRQRQSRFHRGTYRDDLLMGILRGEFRPGAGQEGK